jgi:hypothetical protein
MPSIVRSQRLHEFWDRRFDCSRCADVHVSLTLEHCAALGINGQPTEPQDNSNHKH